MYQKSNVTGFYQKPNEKIELGNYFVIDWLCSNPMNPTRGNPLIIAGNITLDEAQRIVKHQIAIEDVSTAATQRIICKVVQVADLKE